MKLLESWEKPDLDAWADGDRDSLLPEGIILGHQGYRDQDVRRLIAENPDLRFLDYFTVWTYPPKSWIGAGNSFFDYLDSLRKQNGLVWHDSETSYPGISTFKNRWLVRLDGRLDRSSPEHLAQEIVRASRGAGFFLDQFYPDGLDDWMALTLEGNFSTARLDDVLTDSHIETLLELAPELAYYGDLLTGGTSMHASPGYDVASRYFEGVGTFVAHQDWDEILALWKKDPGNVLSVLAEDEPQVDRAIREWTAAGGWLAFTSQLEGEAAVAASSAAYARARDARAAASPHPPDITGPSVPITPGTGPGTGGGSEPVG